MCDACKDSCIRVRLVIYGLRLALMQVDASLTASSWGAISCARCTISSTVRRVSTCLVHPSLPCTSKANLADAPQECVCCTLWVLQDLLAATSGRLGKPDDPMHSRGQSADPEPCRDDAKPEHLSDYLAIVTSILNRHYNSRL